MSTRGAERRDLEAGQELIVDRLVCLFPAALLHIKSGCRRLLRGPAGSKSKCCRSWGCPESPPGWRAGFRHGACAWLARNAEGRMLTAGEWGYGDQKSPWRPFWGLALPQSCSSPRAGPGGCSAAVVDVGGCELGWTHLRCLLGESWKEQGCLGGGGYRACRPVYKVQLRWRLSAAIPKSIDCPAVEVRTWRAQQRCGGGRMSPIWGAPWGAEWGPQQGSALSLGEQSRQCWPSWREWGQRGSVGEQAASPQLCWTGLGRHRLHSSGCSHLGLRGGGGVWNSTVCPANLQAHSW